MGETAYSIQITFESILIHGTGDGAEAGDVYLLAAVGGKRRGRSPTFSAAPNSSIDLSGSGLTWQLRVLGSPAAIPIEVQAWDHDSLSPDDPLGTLSTSVGPPWSATQVKQTATGSNFDLTFSIDVMAIAVSGPSVALVGRQAPGTKHRNTLKAPNVAVATFTQILGLYKPGVDDRASPAPGTTRGAGYLAGYASDDDRGRVFRNRLPDGAWKRDTQYIDITAVVQPATVRLPANAKMVWSFEDPDDPSNEGPDVHHEAGRLLDPNDYGGAAKTGAAGGDNDPSGKTKTAPHFAQLEAKYALSGNETTIDAATRTTRVRFHVSDIAGDNFRVKAEVKTDPMLDGTLPAETGVFTVWDRIDLEYVKMASAAELPVDQIAAHYDMACAQVDVSLKREVHGRADRHVMGRNDSTARTTCNRYCTKALGEFTKEGQGGWFFILAANRLVPAVTATVLWEGDAESEETFVRLPPGIKIHNPGVIRVFNPAKSAGLPSPKPNDRSVHIKFKAEKQVGRSLFFEAHDFHRPEDPDSSFLDANLGDYGMSAGTTVQIQVLSEGEGAMVTAGISPGGRTVGSKTFFGGRLIVFTQSMPASDYIRVLCHELCHAFDNAHKCGNWDWRSQVDRTSCCMNYWFQFVLDNSAPRKPIPWTQDRTSADLCGPHIRRMRDYHLQDNPGLSWP